MRGPSSLVGAMAMAGHTGVGWPRREALASCGSCGPPPAPVWCYQCRLSQGCGVRHEHTASLPPSRTLSPCLPDPPPCPSTCVPASPPPHPTPPQHPPTPTHTRPHPTQPNPHTHPHTRCLQVVQAYLGVRLGVWAYNGGVKHWEPVVEPWAIIAKCDANLGHTVSACACGHTGVYIVSDYRHL